ncbi:DoxX family protein [Lentibacillus cibarius]|uniref:DoxX family protein n=1 Tax=Lentibacillus cibarius TaxID=2583219 RepID=A0A549YGL1_9BACI|nr:DoxX family protein [Lentibacillus cibarius]TMN22246.1 DoxX family protein [Lentibacillus cibarius]TRM11019.1 DoxX family protein [Lentibacillus cibarius]
MQRMHLMKWVCYAVGYVFLISGILKLTTNNFKIAFMNLGLPFPDTILFLVAITEIACSALIIGRMYVKQAAAPLIFIILGAIYLSKLPVLMNQGLLKFAFDARLDIVMLILLLLLWQYKPGKQLS